MYFGSFQRGNLPLSRFWIKIVQIVRLLEYETDEFSLEILRIRTTLYNLINFIRDLFFDVFED